MAMLAEPRKSKEKGSFKSFPNGELWTKDDSKLGQKMLENMGWSKGEGLGKDKQGECDALKPVRKEGKAGLGRTLIDHEAWSQNHDNFEEVLANLNSLNNTPYDSDDDENNEDGKNQKKFSLEDSSKESKARLHYQKFLRGKDVSSYKQNDLACVVGLRKKKNVEVIKDESQEPDGFSNGGNLQEYFNKKFSELTRKRSEGILAPAPGCERNDIESVVDMQFSPSKKEFSFSVDGRNDTLVEENEETIVKKEKKDRKNKKRKDCDEVPMTITDDIIENEDNRTVQPYSYNSIDIKPFGGIVKLFKNKKREEGRLSNVDENNEEEMELEPIKIKKSKKKKREELDENDGEDVRVSEKRKTKIKNKEIKSCAAEMNEHGIEDINEVDVVVEVQDITDQEKEKKLKKKKKKNNKESENYELESISEIQDCNGNPNEIESNECEALNIENKSKHKSKKKSKHEVPIEDLVEKVMQESKISVAQTLDDDNSDVYVEECQHEVNDNVETGSHKKNRRKQQKSVLEDESFSPGVEGRNSGNSFGEGKKRKKSKGSKINDSSIENIEFNDNTSDIVNQSYTNATQMDEKEKRKSDEVDGSESHEVKFNPLKRMKKISSLLNLKELVSIGLDSCGVKKMKKKIESVKNMEDISENDAIDNKRKEETENMDTIGDKWKTVDTWCIKVEKKKKRSNLQI